MQEFLQTMNPQEQSLQWLFQKVMIAILIGLLIGIERERSKQAADKTFAGVRTFPLIALIGFLSALITSMTSIAFFISAFAVFGLLVGISYYFGVKQGDPGATTEVSYLLVFILGALVYWEMLLFSGALSVLIVIFLTFKTHFHKFADRISQEDILATIKFAIITLIILPLLPNQGYGPFSVLNPQKIWYMVILIAGISFVGYILFKLIGTKRGVFVLSILGGIASSTALTLSYTQRSKEVDSISRSLAGGIVLASSIMFPRILIIIFVLSKELGMELLVPFGIFTAGGVIVSLLLFRDNREKQVENLELKNPFKILPAIKFGIVFAVILFVSAAAQHYLGDQGVYLASLASGFLDVDAVALSMSNLGGDSVGIKVAAIAVIIASAANTLTKVGLAAFAGSKGLRKHAVLGMSVLLILTIAYCIFLFVT